MEHNPDHITIYTDGASRGNPGPGGYGVVMMYGDKRKELSKGYKKTTNNRMELMAVIAGLEALKNKAYPVKIYSDSKYVVDAIQKKWIDKWMQTNFAGGKKNADLWRRYVAAASGVKLRFYWVKGHAENAFNNRCDMLATTAADGGDLEDDVGFENAAQ